MPCLSPYWPRQQSKQISLIYLCGFFFHKFYVRQWIMSLHVIVHEVYSMRRGDHASSLTWSPSFHVQECAK